MSVIAEGNERERQTTHGVFMFISQYWCIDFVDGGCLIDDQIFISKRGKFYYLFVRIKFQYKVTVVSNYTNHVFKISSTC